MKVALGLDSTNQVGHLDLRLKKQGVDVVHVTDYSELLELQGLDGAIIPVPFPLYGDSEEGYELIVANEAKHRGVTNKFVAIRPEGDEDDRFLPEEGIFYTNPSRVIKILCYFQEKDHLDEIV